jgi:hypothetical protein
LFRQTGSPLAKGGGGYWMLTSILNYPFEVPVRLNEAPASPLNNMGY